MKVIKCTLKIASKCRNVNNIIFCCCYYNGDWVCLLNDLWKRIYYYTDICAISQRFDEINKFQTMREFIKGHFDIQMKILFDCDCESDSKRVVFLKLLFSKQVRVKEKSDGSNLIIFYQRYHVRKTSKFYFPQNFSVCCLTVMKHFLAQFDL